MKSVFTAAEFQQLIRQGRVKQEGKRLVLPSLLPEFEETLDRIEGVWIPGQSFSSKNSKQILPKYCTRGSIWTFKGKPCLPFISNSKVVTAYKKAKLEVFNANRDKFQQMLVGKTMPYVIEFTFYRSGYGRWDFQNMVQLLCDLMVDCHWLPDDNIDVMLPIPPMPPKRAYHIDKLNPGVLIKVL